MFFHFDYPAFLIHSLYADERLLDKIRTAKAAELEAEGIAKIHKVLEKILFSYFKISGLDAFYLAMRRKAQIEEEHEKRKLLASGVCSTAEANELFSKYITSSSRSFLMEIDEYLYRFSKELYHVPAEQLWSHITNRIHGSLYSFFMTLIASGRTQLKQEHAETMQKIAELDTYSAVDFEYYVELRYESFVNKPYKTIQDFYGYLSYLEQFAIDKRKLASTGYTQSQKKAEDLYQLVHKIRGELEYKENELLEGECRRMGALQALLVQLQFGERIRPEYQEQVAAQVYELKEGSSLWQSSVFKDEQGQFQLDETVAAALKCELNYWNKESALSRARQNDVTQIQEFISNSTHNPQSPDIMFRYINKPEYQEVKTHTRISQHNKNSFERSKWFFHGHAQVGNNVEHEYLCKIHLKPGTLQLLLSLAKLDSTTDAVLVKENERDCIGIHEDVLPLFNQLIVFVTLHPRKYPDKKETIQFAAPPSNNESTNDIEEVDSPSHAPRYYVSSPR